jgi:serine protease Do
MTGICDSTAVGGCLSMRVKRAGLVAAAIALVLSLPVSAHAQRRAPTVDVSATVEATTRAVNPAVVEIVSTGYTVGDGTDPRATNLIARQRSLGSGVIVDPEGYIVTNAHVVGGAQRLRVDVPSAPAGRSILASGSRSVDATIVGLDLETDLAVIKIDERNLPALAFGDSDELKQGQLVLAFGSPMGLQNSVSMGIVSAIARQLAPESPMIYIQTDASINPGSSGGPLVDLRGRIVGINTLVLTQGGGSDGLGFAAPSNIVRTVYEQIRHNGFVRRGDIGVRAQTITPVLAAGLNLPRDKGALLADVFPASAAAIAGLMRGDIVLAIDGKPIENGRQLHVTLYRRLAGEVVTIEILRDSQPRRVSVVMDDRHDPLTGLSRPIDPRRNLIPRLDMLGVNVDAEVVQRLPWLRLRFGVLVVSKVPGTPDARQDELVAGDVVFGVNRTPVTGLDDLRTVLEALKPGEPAVLHVERRGERMYLEFIVE